MSRASIDDDYERGGATVDDETRANASRLSAHQIEGLHRVGMTPAERLEGPSLRVGDRVFGIGWSGGTVPGEVTSVGVGIVRVQQPEVGGVPWPEHDAHRELLRVVPLSVLATTDDRPEE